jgi:superfamily II DNA or RNA helicase
VQLFRPTDSLSLYLQQVGRGLRKCDGKPYAVVLDHVGNSHRHGLPTDDREWTLEGKVGRQGGEKAPSVKICPQCFSAMASAKHACPECGHQFVAERRELEHVDGELVEVQRREAKREQAQAHTVEQLVALGKQRRMKNPHGWARHVMAARQAKGQWSKVA